MRLAHLGLAQLVYIRYHQQYPAPMDFAPRLLSSCHFVLNVLPLFQSWPMLQHLLLKLTDLHQHLSKLSPSPIWQLLPPLSTRPFSLLLVCSSSPIQQSTWSMLLSRSCDDGGIFHSQLISANIEIVVHCWDLIWYRQMIYCSVAQSTTVIGSWPVPIITSWPLFNLHISRGPFSQSLSHPSYPEPSNSVP